MILLVKLEKGIQFDIICSFVSITLGELETFLIKVWTKCLNCVTMPLVKYYFGYFIWMEYIMTGVLGHQPANQLTKQPTHKL